MYNIIFVDDEQRVLDGLKRMLYKRRNEWNMVFAISGEEALSRMNDISFDLVVSDMRMPKMDGAELLSHVKERNPSIIRVVLSGQMDQITALQALSVSHQFLMKPCDPKKQELIIESLLALRSLTSTPEDIVYTGSYGKIPLLANQIQNIKEQLNNPELSTTALISLIEALPSVVAKVLQVANSSFSGFDRGTATVESAIKAVGSHLIRSILTSDLTINIIDNTHAVDSRIMSYVQEKSLLTAKIAASLSCNQEHAGTAFACGLLHRIALYPFLEHTRLTESHVFINNRQHLRLSAYMAGLWGLPSNLVMCLQTAAEKELLNNHATHFDAAHALHIADYLTTHQLSPHYQDISNWITNPTDQSFLDGLTTHSKWSEWVSLAEGIHSGTTSLRT